MPFDPTRPADGANVTAAELRNQFNGLAEMIAAIPAGPPGEPGPQGPPGEVTAQLADAVSSAVEPLYTGTARNPGTVADLGLTISDPPTQAEVQALAAKLDELIIALKRPT
jgi:hypothetical protein